MIVLTGHGSFAEEYLKQFGSDQVAVASLRELGEAAFIEKLRSASVVIHNAATVHCEGLDQAVERNFDFTRFVVKQLEAHNPKAHLIFLSSMSVLDPTNDQQYGNVLDMPAYAYSKYLAETFCLKSSLPQVSCVRFSTLFYGDPIKDGLSKLAVDAVNTRKITLYNHGEALRNFLPLRIAVQYVEKIAGLKKQGKQTYTLAAPEATSFKAVAQTLQKLVDGLEIGNQDAPAGTPVLANFETKDISALGQVTFSLNDEIADYVQRIGK